MAEPSAEPSAPATDFAVRRLLPVLIVVGAAGMTAFQLVAFQNKLPALIFGVMMIISGALLALERTRPRRVVLLACCGVLIAAAAGLAVTMFVATNNPSAFIFGMMMLLSTLVVLFGGLRDVRTGTPGMK